MSTNGRSARNRSDAAIWVLGVACGVPLLAAVVIAGLFMTGAPDFTNLQQANAASRTPASGQNLHMTIVTNAGPHHNWPGFEPAAITVPSNTSVTITVTNLDGATPL